MNIEPLTAMKTPLKLIAVVAAVAAVVILGTLVTRSSLIQAQQPAVPVVVNPTPKQYKVVDIGQIPVAPGRNSAGTLEAVLNEMGAQGWRVVATSGSFVILMR